MPQSAISKLRASQSNSTNGIRTATVSQPPARGSRTRPGASRSTSPVPEPQAKRRKLSTTKDEYVLKYDYPSTPWRDASELAHLRDSFFPEKMVLSPYSTPPPDSRLQAVEQVRSYEKSRPRLVPHAMSATAMLSEAVAFDEGFADKVSQGIVRSAYSMAFARFVTGFVDRDVRMERLGVLVRSNGKDENGNFDDSESDSEVEADQREQGGQGRVHVPKNIGESSMYAYAKRIGMPSHFVDLRHATVHGQLNSVTDLRQRSREGLDWLWEVWWKRHVKGDAAREKRRKWLAIVDDEDHCEQTHREVV